MNQPFDTIGILTKREDADVRGTLDRLIDDLSARGKSIVIENDYRSQLDEAVAAHVEYQPRARIGGLCDLVVVIGGDGTLLEAGRAVAAHDTPVLGVNLGRLGFMVDVLPEDMSRTLDDVFAGNCIADTRLMLDARVQHADGQYANDPLPAINECVVRNQAFARVLDFDTYMNGDFISHHRADGMVIATPTGSTAYALSGGGPVLHPGLNALAMVPICPHTLSDRPLIVDADHPIEIRVADTLEGAAVFTSDGQLTQPLEPGESVHIGRGRYDLRLLHPPGYDYFNILRSKLHWGRGQSLKNT